MYHSSCDHTWLGATEKLEVPETKILRPVPCLHVRSETMGIFRAFGQKKYKSRRKKLSPKQRQQVEFQKGPPGSEDSEMVLDSLHVC